MFTGLIQSVGKVSQISKNQEGILLTVSDSYISKNVKVEDSVSINGACQTVVRFDESSFTVQAVQTTLQKTNFKNLKPGSPVNLELALRLSDRLGGHLVQGHVNGVGNILDWNKRGKNYELSFRIPKDLMRYVVSEGSITLNGISLTISSLDKQSNVGTVSIIPHTWDNTTFVNVNKSDEINIEVDILAKYVENLLFHGSNSGKYVKEQPQSKITESWLKSQGFWE